MRIGQFANKYNVSIDTIRHYMDMGLILPNKDGAQYTFDLECQQDLSVVLELKSLGFSLMEIRSFLFYKRLSKLKPIQNEQFYIDLLKTKEKELKEEINLLTTTLNKIDSRLDEVKKQEFVKRKIGVPLDTINIFSCPKCKGHLSLNSTEITDNNIMEGTLSCNCGESIIINNGIVIYGQEPIPLTIEEEEEAKIFFADYVKHTPADFFDKFYKAYEWVNTKINLSNLGGKIILEIGSGAGLFIRTLYDHLPEDTVYICVDNDHVINYFLKEILEHDDQKKKVIFITAEFHDIPLKDKSVDYLVDAVGTTNYIFDIDDQVSQNFLLSDLMYLLNDNVTLIGSYMLFTKFSLTHPYIPLKNQTLFIKEYIDEQIKKLGFEIIHEKSSKYLPVGGKYENIFVAGDKVYIYMIIGKM